MTAFLAICAAYAIGSAALAAIAARVIRDGWRG